ncbi:MAG: DNA repair protein RecO [bacterium]
MEIPVYKTQGIILKKAELNDTDRLLTIYTEKFGKILVRARGIGKKESKLKCLIEPFNVYEFLLARSKNIDVLANSYPIKEFLGLRQDLESLSLAIYFAELVDKLIPAPESDAKIWMLLTRAMEAVDKFNSPQPSLKIREGENTKSITPLKVRGGGGVMITLDNIKPAFEEKLVEFLGHPNFSVRGKTTEREISHYLESLAGEEIRAVKFLRSLSLTS